MTIAVAIAIAVAVAFAIAYGNVISYGCGLWSGFSIYCLLPLLTAIADCHCYRDCLWLWFMD